MTDAPSTIRVVIPLKIKRRNRCARIVPPDNIDLVEPDAQEPRLLRAIARAWNWRRMLERGEAATLSDIAQAEHVTLAFISRYIRLAYLAPMVLQQLLIHRRPCALSLDRLAAAALAPWIEQPAMVFED